MVLALGTLKTSIVTLYMMSAIVSGTQTCQTLRDLYQGNVDTVSDAVDAFQRCTSERTEPGLCSTETYRVVVARENLQAAFATYLRTCGSRLAEGAIIAKGWLRQCPAPQGFQRRNARAR
jgi:hypothetical protein